MTDSAPSSSTLLHAASPLQLRHPAARHSPAAPSDSDWDDQASRHNAPALSFYGGITLEHALAKIRKLNNEIARLEEKRAADRDAQRDLLANERKQQREELEWAKARAKEREEFLLDKVDPARIRSDAFKEAAEEAENEQRGLREALAVAEEHREQLKAEVDALRLEDEQRTAAMQAERARQEAEVKVLKQMVERDTEERKALKAALERERTLLEEERRQWKAVEAENVDALAGCRRQAARAQLNARWVASVRRNLADRKCAARAAAAAAELCGELLARARDQCGAAAADATLHHALRTATENGGCASAVARAQSAGVDVAVMLSQMLRDFSDVRAAANVRAGVAVAAKTAHSTSQQVPCAWLAAATARSAAEPSPPSPTGGEASAQLSPQTGGSGPTATESPQSSGAAQQQPPADDAAAMPSKGPQPSAGSRLRPPSDVEDQQLAQQVAMRRGLLQRALQLQSEAQDLVRPRQAESPRWSPPPSPQQPQRSSAAPKARAPGVRHSPPRPVSPPAAVSPPSSPRMPGERTSVGPRAGGRPRRRQGRPASATESPPRRSSSAPAGATPLKGALRKKQSRQQQQQQQLHLQQQPWGHWDSHSSNPASSAAPSPWRGRTDAASYDGWAAWRSYWQAMYASSAGTVPVDPYSYGPYPGQQGWQQPATAAELDIPADVYAAI